MNELNIRRWSSVFVSLGKKACRCRVVKPRTSTLCIRSSDRACRRIIRDNFSAEVALVYSNVSTAEALLGRRKVIGICVGFSGRLEERLRRKTMLF